MPSRQDKLHAYQFSTQRVVSALTAQEPNPVEPLFRRPNNAVLASVVVAMLGLAGAAAYGQIVKDGPVEWRNPTAVFVEKDTGARYVYYQPDDKLHPVLNYTSALLIVGSPNARVVSKSRKTLAKAPRGLPMGIPGAPDSLPGASDLVAKPWTLCSRSAAGSRGPQTVLSVADQPRGGYPVAAAKPGTAGEGILASAPDNTIHLVYDNRRFAIPDTGTVRAAFGWRNHQPARLASAVLNAIPTGPDIKVPTVTRRGERSSRLDALIGQLFMAPVQGGGFQFKVALDDGAAYVSDVQAALLRADPNQPAPPITLETAAFSKLPPSTKRLGESADALPPTVPTLVTVSQSVCVTISTAPQAVSTVLVDPAMPEAPPPGATPSTSGTRTALADGVAVPRGGGVLVEAAASPDAAAGSGAVSLITDAGVRYPLASREVSAFLGYQAVAPLRMSAGLVALIPAGPALDPAAAVDPA